MFSWTIPREQKFGESAQQGEIVTFCLILFTFLYLSSFVYYFYIVCEM